MKKVLTVIAVIIIAVMLVACGYANGVHHAIVDSEMYITEITPEEGKPYDLTVYVDLDGQTYAHEMFIC